MRAGALYSEHAANSAREVFTSKVPVNKKDGWMQVRSTIKNAAKVDEASTSTFRLDRSNYDMHASRLDKRTRSEAWSDARVR